MGRECFGTCPSKNARTPTHPLQPKRLEPKWLRFRRVRVGYIYFHIDRDIFNHCSSILRTNGPRHRAPQNSTPGARHEPKATEVPRTAHHPVGNAYHPDTRPGTTNTNLQVFLVYALPLRMDERTRGLASLHLPGQEKTNRNIFWKPVSRAAQCPVAVRSGSAPL